MVPLNPDDVDRKLRAWTGQTVFLHVEVNPGAYWRNGKATLSQFHVKGHGPYRLFLQLDNFEGLIQMDDLTHMEVSPSMLICTGYDDHGRIARTIEVSTEPFAV